MKRDKRKQIQEKNKVVITDVNASNATVNIVQETQIESNETNCTAQTEDIDSEFFLLFFFI